MTGFEVGRVDGKALSLPLDIHTLTTAGLLESSGGRFAPNDIARRDYGHLSDSHGGSEAIGVWKAKLGAGPTRMIEALEASALTLDELAAAVGNERSGGTFRTYLSKLRTNELIVERDGVVALADWLT